MPLANEYPHSDANNVSQTCYPLRAHVCSECWLVQMSEVETPERLFSEYAYFSSYSTTWLEHAKRYAYDMAHRLQLGPRSLVVEVGSNDGYLLQYFREQGIPVLGVEPARNVAAVAQERGIKTISHLLDTRLAASLIAKGTQDLLVANNVLAHAPDLNDFVKALAMLLKPTGVLTLEFPHLLRLILGNQFDTIYHEHLSYFSLSTARLVLAKHGLQLFDVEELPTHGGSLRLYLQTTQGKHAEIFRINAVSEAEKFAGLDQLEIYKSFQVRASAIKHALLDFLDKAKREGKTVVGYGAAAKGNTLLNFCGVHGDLIDYIVDRSPHKQGRFMPGTRLAIHPLERIEQTRPDYVLLLAWNLKEEIMGQLSAIKDWGAQFVVAVPRLEVLS
jgi:SAM-dependent methyltransferase